MNNNNNIRRNPCVITLH